MRPVPGTNPFLGVRTPEQTTALEQARRDNDIGSPAQKPAILNLAAYIRNCFNQAEHHRNVTGVTQRLIDCMRRRRGQYPPDKLADIRAVRGNETYFNLTKTKCATLEALLQDVMAPAGDSPWDIEATPVPDLGEEMRARVIHGVVATFSVTGAPVDPAEVQRFTLDLYDKTLSEVIAEARRRVERMKRLIDDQLTEGGFMQALLTFNRHFATYPTAFLKGPILTRRMTLAYIDGKVVTQEQEFHVWEAPDPQNVYPAPNARQLSDGPLCERVTYSATDLMLMRGQPGWSAEAIDRVLAELADSGSVVTQTLTTGESERAEVENRDLTIHSGNAPGTVDCIEFWGSPPVKLLREWGMPGLDGASDTEFRSIHAVLIGNHVVRAILNPNPLGEIPWSSASVEPEPNSVWGIALAEDMADCQDPYNACLRNLLDNLAISSGPQVACDVDALAEGENSRDVYPWKTWHYNGSTIPNGSRKPIDFFQPESNAEVLTRVAEYFELKADERTRIPKFTHGEANVGGAGDTASGLSMLMNAANKGIKRLLGFVDQNIIRTSVTRQYVWNMLNIDDDAIKADARIRPRGILALLVKEQVQLRRQEFLDRTANPTDMAIIGMRGRATILRAVAQGLDLPEDKVVPSDEELMQRAQAVLQSPAPPPVSQGAAA